MRTGGGGGWGSPLDRDAELVRQDVIEEFISRDAARTDYGVVLAADGSVDKAATERERKTLRSKAKTA